LHLKSSRGLYVLSTGKVLEIIYRLRLSLSQCAGLQNQSSVPPSIYPSLRHTSCEVVPGAVVLLHLVELGIGDEAQRRSVSGIDMYIGECGVQRSAMEDHELHQLVQGLPVLGPNRVRR